MEFIVVILIIALVVFLIVRSRKRDRPTSPTGASPGPRATAAAAAVQLPSPTFRVIALGGSGAGKTVFLSSMFHLLNFRTPLRSYYLETPPDQAITLSNIYEGVSNTERPWPSGTRTADTREFIFDCVGSDEHGDRRTVLRLSFLDYSGGLLERVEESTDPAFRDLVAKITNASGLLLMIDGYRIRQLINNENKGRLYFQHTIRPLIGFAQRANCPIQFVLTKWDLVRDVGALRGLDDGTRLRRVVDALMEFEHIKALIYVHSNHQSVRMIPVSSVGSDFATIDSNGFVVKMPNGVVSPTNVDLPLSAIIPDLFRQVEASLNAETKCAADNAARDWTGLGWGQFLSAVNAFVGGPAGLVIGATLQGLLGSTHREVYTVFVDWISRRHQEKDGAVRPFRNEAEREVAKVQAIRARVMNDFDRSMYQLEFQYPRSLLSSR